MLIKNNKLVVGYLKHKQIVLCYRLLLLQLRCSVLYYNYIVQLDIQASLFRSSRGERLLLLPASNHHARFCSRARALATITRASTYSPPNQTAHKQTFIKCIPSAIPFWMRMLRLSITVNRSIFNLSPLDKSKLSRCCSGP